MAGPLELGTGCIGCRTYPEEYFPRRDALADEAVEGVSEDEPAVELAVADALPADLVERQADLDRLQRYARYVVSADEDAQAAPASFQDEASAIQGDEVAAAAE